MLTRLLLEDGTRNLSGVRQRIDSAKANKYRVIKVCKYPSK